MGKDPRDKVRVHEQFEFYPARAQRNKKKLQQQQQQLEKYNEILLPRRFTDVHQNENDGSLESQTVPLPFPIQKKNGIK